MRYLLAFGILIDSSGFPCCRYMIQRPGLEKAKFCVATDSDTPWVPVILVSKLTNEITSE